MQFLNSFWKIHSPLLINAIFWYISSIWCKINLFIILVTPDWNILYKSVATKSFYQKLEGNLKPLCFHQEMRKKLPKWSPLCIIIFASVSNNFAIMFSSFPRRNYGIKFKPFLSLDNLDNFRNFNFSLLDI